ncbi:MAG: beta-propeller fold lactonase family protein [Burkholderiales bacterium]
MVVLAQPAQAEPFAYITNYNDNTVSVIDTAGNPPSVSATVAVGIRPVGVAVTPDGSRVYVANSNVFGTVSVINTADNSVSETVAVGNYYPWGVAVTPDGSKVYVTNNNVFGTVAVINTADNSVSATVTVGNYPFGVAVTPDGSRVYVANQGSGTVSVIDAGSNTISATVVVGNAPLGVAVTPNGSRVYVGNISNTVSVINTADNSVSATVPVGINPEGVAVTPDGSRVYVANWGSGTVSVIDTASNSVSATVTVGDYPYGVAVTPDGSQVYVANGNSGTVSVINTNDNSVTTPVTGLNGPVGFGQFIKPATTDNTPPTCTVSATPNTLRSPNHKLVNIITTVNVSDSGSGPNGFKLLSISSSEADVGLGSDEVAGDIQGWIVNTPDTAGQLRNERYAKAGRTYTFTYQARDLAGNTGNCSTTVKVPNNQRK